MVDAAAQALLNSIVRFKAAVQAEVAQSGVHPCPGTQVAATTLQASIEADFEFQPTRGAAGRPALRLTNTTLRRLVWCLWTFQIGSENENWSCGDEFFRPKSTFSSTSGSTRQSLWSSRPPPRPESIGNCNESTHRL